MNNERVVSAWIAGEAGSNPRKSLRTDGVRLWSYSLLIGEVVDGVYEVKNYTASGEWISQTTSHHVGLANRALANIN